MNKADSQTELIALRAGGLEVRFPKTGDRHAMKVGTPLGLLMEAFSGCEAEAWPSAPPLQQLHLQETPTGTAVLGVGSAGRTHWSAAFSAREPGVIWCEYAARLALPWDPSGEWLGTRFRLTSCRAPFAGEVFWEKVPDTFFRGRRTVEWKFVLHLNHKGVFVS